MLQDLGVATLCNNDAGPITLQPLNYVIVALVYNNYYSLMYVWLGHGTISSIGSLVVNCLFVDMGCVCIVQPTHVCSTGITVWLVLRISVVKGIKSTFMNESSPVLLVP